MARFIGKDRTGRSVSGEEVDVKAKEKIQLGERSDEVVCTRGTPSGWNRE